MLLEQKVSLDCDHVNFTSCDQCVLNLLHPNLMQVEENNPALHRIQQILRQFKQAIDQEGVISLTIDGQVQFMTQQAQQLLGQYCSFCSPTSLPNPLNHWFKQQISQLGLEGNGSFSCLTLLREETGWQLIIRLISSSARDHYLLLLEEQELQSFSISALESLGLTSREAEVLFWVAKDKSNAGIARVLGCCEGTIRKHLEHLYGKLGVQTRMGAVMIALEKLELLKAKFITSSS